jgi:hypothetical protein
LGALVINRDKTWTRSELFTYASTGMGSALLTLAFVKFLWQLVRLPDLPPWQLLLLLLVTALGATFGSTSFIGNYITYGVSWALALMRRTTMVVAGIIGGLLGYVLSMGFSLSLLTLFGILAGVGIVMALVWQIDRIMQQPNQADQP